MRNNREIRQVLISPLFRISMERCCVEGQMIAVNVGIPANELTKRMQGPPSHAGHWRSQHTGVAAWQRSGQMHKEGTVRCLVPASLKLYPKPSESV